MNMLIGKCAVVATALAGFALAGAVPAAAEPPSGSYTRTNTDGKSAPFEVLLTPCGAGCTHYALAANPENGSDYHLQGNRWVADPNPIVTSSFDKDSLVGAYTLRVPTFGADPQQVSGSFTLVKNG
jgi:hypothetical protein